MSTNQYVTMETNRQWYWENGTN